MPDALKVIVKSPFSGYSGYGQDGFGLLRALHLWGCDVYPQPTWLDVPIPADLLPLFGKTLAGPFDLLINHWDPSHLYITRSAREMSRVAIAWSMWEFAGSPPGAIRPCKKHERENPGGMGVEGCERCRPGPFSGLVPHCEARSSLRERLRWFDMVLGYDEVSLAALESYIPQKVHRGVLQGGYEASDWRKFERDWFGERFQFIMHGALGPRKCPWTVIQAFQNLKFEKREEFAGARLALHTSVPGTLFPELNEPFAKSNSGIKVFVDAFDRQTMEEFYRAGHCLLSPSRGEGKNLPALEFMTTGGVVAATNFSGHTQWMNADYAYPLDYTLGATHGDKPWAAQDAKVSVEHMQERIWHIFTHRAEAKRKAELAAQVIPKLCDWQVVVENLFRRIGDVVKGPGPEVYAKALACRRNIRTVESPDFSLGHAVRA